MFEGLEDFSPEKLAAARREFEEVFDLWTRWMDEANEDIDFYHGVQWNAEDLKKLREQQRPALTFNLIQAKIAHTIGAESENLHHARVVNRSLDDVLAADVLNQLLVPTREYGGYDEAEGRAFEDGVTCGIGMVSLYSEPDPHDILSTKVCYESIDPTDVWWDLGARRKDYSDARYLFRARWLTKSEFRASYPDMEKEDVDALFSRATGLDVGRSDSPVEPRLDDGDPLFLRRPTMYFDAKRKRVRVVHMEYVEDVLTTVALDRETLEQHEVSLGQVDLLERNWPGRFEMIDTYRPRVRWLEFCGTHVLFDDWNPQPYDGFSVRAFVYQRDRDGFPYGKVRALKDPQRETNKRHSHTLHLIAQQGAPGLIAETGALVDAANAKDAMKTGDVVEVSVGKFDKVTERKPPVFPEAAARMEEAAMRLIDLISNVYADDMREPRGIPEAAATTQLKQRRSMLTMLPVLKNFHRFRSDLTKSEVQTIQTLYSDRQIGLYLADATRYEVAGGLVTDKESGQSVPIRDVRRAQFNVRVVAAESNSTDRIVAFQTLLALQQLGVPVDPVILYEMSGLPSDKVERLKGFLKGSMMTQSQLAQAQLASTQDQIQRQFVLDRGDLEVRAQEVAERARANRAKEFLAGRKQTLDWRSAIATIWERADATEKNFIHAMLSEVLQMQQARELAAGDESQGDEELTA